MRKIVFLFFIIMVLLLCISNNSKVLIPDESIRIRIIADSNDVSSQKLKSDIKSEITNYLYEKLKNSNTYNDAKNTVRDSINDVKSIVTKYTDDFTVSFGNNYFPSKEYKGTTYKAGDYESLVITLGSGNGNNFWCVLFPPLCMIDENELSNAKYRLFVSELLNKIK